MLPYDLLNILACPVCKGKLEARDNEQNLFCHACKKEYTVRDGIPVLLADEATPCAERNHH